jgi:hypothetical protein
MSALATTPAERCTAIVAALRGQPGAAQPSDAGKSFGASGHKVYTKTFAMLVGGKLVVKLPGPRVDALVVAGDGERFDPRHLGRLMREWVAVDPTSKANWQALATEAMAFVV